MWTDKYLRKTMLTLSSPLHSSEQHGDDNKENILAGQDCSKIEQNHLETSALGKISKGICTPKKQNYSTDGTEIKGENNLDESEGDVFNDPLKAKLSFVSDKSEYVKVSCKESDLHHRIYGNDTFLPDCVTSSVSQNSEIVEPRDLLVCDVESDKESRKSDHFEETKCNSCEDSTNPVGESCDNTEKLQNVHDNRTLSATSDVDESYEFCENQKNQNNECEQYLSEGDLLKVNGNKSSVISDEKSVITKSTPNKLHDSDAIESFEVSDGTFNEDVDTTLISCEYAKQDDESSLSSELEKTLVFIAKGESPQESVIIVSEEIVQSCDVLGIENTNIISSCSISDNSIQQINTDITEKIFSKSESHDTILPIDCHEKDCDNSLFEGVSNLTEKIIVESINPESKVEFPEAIDQKLDRSVDSSEVKISELQNNVSENVPSDYSTYELEEKTSLLVTDSSCYCKANVEGTVANYQVKDSEVETCNLSSVQESQYDNLNKTILIDEDSYRHIKNRGEIPDKEISLLASEPKTLSSLQNNEIESNLSSGEVGTNTDFVNSTNYAEQSSFSTHSLIYSKDKQNTSGSYSCDCENSTLKEYSIHNLSDIVHEHSSVFQNTSPILSKVAEIISPNSSLKFTEIKSLSSSELKSSFSNQSPENSSSENIEKSTIIFASDSSGKSSDISFDQQKRPDQDKSFIKSPISETILAVIKQTAEEISAKNTSEFSVTEKIKDAAENIDSTISKLAEHIGPQSLQTEAGIEKNKLSFTSRGTESRNTSVCEVSSFSVESKIEHSPKLKSNSPIEIAIVDSVDNISSRTQGISKEMAELNEKLQQENSDLKLELNAAKQAKASLELEISKKDEIVLKTQAESLRKEQQFQQDIKALKEQLKEKSNYNEEDVVKELEESLKEAKAKETHVISELNAKVNNELKYRKLLEEFEKTITTRFAEHQKLKEENKTVTRHLANLELSFSDLHQKYERTKSVILGLKSNEEVLRKACAEFEERFHKQDEKYDSLKAHAKAQIEKSNKEILQLKEKYEIDVSKLNAIIKRLEIKSAALETALDQKTNECIALAALCDEVTGKKV